MASKPLKIVALKLEHLVVKGRGEGKTYPQILDDLNEELIRRADFDGTDADSVSIAALNRYIRGLDKATVPVVHQPQHAAQNAALALNAGGEFMAMFDKLKVWLAEAEGGDLVKDSDGDPVIIDGEPLRWTNWHARLGVAREVREALKLYGDWMERIYNAQQIKDFQEATLEAVREADPETAQRIVGKLRERQSIRRSALLGLDT